MKTRYIRVSTINQKIERQLEKQYPDEKIYIDKLNGSIPFSERVHKNNIFLKVDNLGLESWVNGKENPTFKLIISVLANISEMKRNSLLERQKEGIAIAKAKGIYKGRLKNTTESVDEFLAKYPNVIHYLNKKIHQPL